MSEWEHLSYGFHSDAVSAPPDLSHLEKRLKDTLKEPLPFEMFTRAPWICHLAAGISELQTRTFEEYVWKLLDSVCERRPRTSLRLVSSWNTTCMSQAISCDLWNVNLLKVPRSCTLPVHIVQLNRCQLAAPSVLPPWCVGKLCISSWWEIKRFKARLGHRNTIPFSWVRDKSSFTRAGSEVWPLSVFSSNFL